MGNFYTFALLELFLHCYTLEKKHFARYPWTILPGPNFFYTSTASAASDKYHVRMMMTEKSKSPNPKYEADVKHVFLGLIIRSARTSGFDRFCVKYIWTIIGAGAAIINNAGNIYHIIKMMIIVDWLFTKQMRI